MQRPTCRNPLSATSLAMSAALVLVAAHIVWADVVPYECDSFPEDSGWDIIQIFCEPELWIEDGWFFQRLDLCPDDPPGQQAAYERSLDDFIGEEQFFIEWIVETDADRAEIPFGGGAALATGGNGPVRYTFFITRDLVKLNRDNTLPIIFVDIEPDVPHTYRLELFGAELYVWYIDGNVADSGKPEGPYPSGNPGLVFVARSVLSDNSTRWNYIRYGTIPANPGDFNSDGEIDFYDLYFFQECLTTEAGGWPGCVWADMDSGGDTDCDDWALFLEAWTDPTDPPGMPECAKPPDFDGNGSVGPWDLAILLGNWGPCPDEGDCPADLDDDGTVGAADLAMLLGNWG